MIVHHDNLEMNGVSSLRSGDKVYIWIAADSELHIDTDPENFIIGADIMFVASLGVSKKFKVYYGTLNTDDAKVIADHGWKLGKEYEGAVRQIFPNLFDLGWKFVQEY